MPLAVQYLDKSWIVKLLNIIGELLKINNLTEEYAFEVIDRTLPRIAIVTINIYFTTSGALSVGMKLISHMFFILLICVHFNILGKFILVCKVF
jgi:hypothetical protein